MELKIKGPKGYVEQACDYTPSPEGRLWHAVLGSFFTDASVCNDRDWIVLSQQAQSPWVKEICFLIDLDHDFFIEQLLKARKTRRKITFMPGGAIIGKAKEGG